MRRADKAFVLGSRSKPKPKKSPWSVAAGETYGREAVGYLEIAIGGGCFAEVRLSPWLLALGGALRDAVCGAGEE